MEDNKMEMNMSEMNESMGSQSIRSGDVNTDCGYMLQVERGGVHK